MGKKPQFMVDIESKSIDQIESELTAIRNKNRKIFDELAKY